MKKVIENWLVDEYSFKHGIYHIWITEKHHYVGSSVNLAKRLLRHRSDLIRCDHDNQKMQRCFNKYGLDSMKFEILEICPDDISYLDLLKREKHFIDLLNPDLNIKLDPVTQQGCSTTSQKVFQFNQFGELVEEWDCISEAARQLKIDSSGITVACKNRNRQRICGGYLWDYTPIYTGNLDIIYVFDLSGNYLNRFYDTINIYKEYFRNKSRKTVLSQLNKKIDCGTPYENIYLSKNKDFKINPDYKPKYKEQDELEKILAENPKVYKFNKEGKIIEEHLFKDWRHLSFIKRKVRESYENSSRSSISYYSIDKNYNPPRFNNYNEIKVKITNIITNETKHYLSLKDGVMDTFSNIVGDFGNIYRNCKKHITSKKPYKGYLFERDL